MEEFFSEEFWTDVRHRQSIGQRYGQAVFNSAVWHYQEARSFRGTFVDPFYRDDKVGVFLTALLEELTKPRRVK